MPDYHYVSSAHGTATTGDQVYTQAQRDAHSGNITTLAASTVYTTIENCLNNATIADGDIILIADNHSYSAGASISIIYTGPADQTTYFVSIDNTAIQNYKKATTFQERTSITANWDMRFNGDYHRWVMQGIFLTLGQTDTSTHNFELSGFGSTFEFIDCTIDFDTTGAGSRWTILSDGQLVYCKDTEVNFGNAAHEIDYGDGTVIIFDGVTSTGTAVDDIIGQTAVTGGVTVKMLNTRLDQLIVVNGELFDSLSTGVEYVDVEVKNCLVPTGFDWIAVTPTKQQHFSVTMESFGTADEYYNFYHETIAGKVEEDTVQYLTTGATYDGTNEFSFKFTPSTSAINVNFNAPLRYPIAVLPNQNLSSAKTYTVELVSADAALTDVDVWLEIEVQDGTNQALGKKYTTRNSNIFAAGTALTSSSAVWATTTNTEYSIADTITEAGSTNSNVKVYLCVAKPNIVVNVDPAVAVS